MLSINNLSLTLGEFSIGNLSIEMERGEYMVLLGPSGSGKTSLLKALCGLVPITGGTIEVERKIVSSLPPQKRGIGYVPQAATLFPNMNVRQNISFGLPYLDGDSEHYKQLMEELCRTLAIDHLLDRDIFHLSGGEAKRVALARSLVLMPQVLLLDEPLSMLDHNAREGLVRMLKEVCTAYNLAVIHVTHDREEAWSLAGTCAIMETGKIRQVGRLETVFRKPASRFVAQFTGARNVFNATFSSDSVLSVANVGWAKFIVPRELKAEKGCIVVRPESLMIVDDRNIAEVEAKAQEVLDLGAYAQVVFNPVGSEEKVYAHFPVHIANKIQPGKVYFLKTDRLPHAIECEVER